MLWKSDGCGPSAVLPLGKRDLVVTCYDAGTIARVSRDGKRSTYDKDKAGGALQGPTTLRPTAKAASSSLHRVLGNRDRLSGMSSTYRGRTNHKKKKKKKEVANDLHYANGILLSADGKRL